MKAVTNKTQRPVSVPLPRGKVLHLGPAKTAQISSEAASHPGVKKLLEDGTIEMLDDGAGSADGPGGGRRSGAGLSGHARSGGGRRGGDR